MADRIVLVDPDTNKVQHLESASFTDLNVRERQQLENWVLQNPAVLGEQLLVITPEFARFDKSKLRLDLLALDERGTLVVIELKLDAANSLADLQAIRYAAFCSTMQTDDVVRELAAYEEVSEEEAGAKILEFLRADELPALGDEPRIILAAGSIDDQALTSSVLWLRRLGVDITCVEITPYRLPDTQQLMLVPRVIIPLPEARDYVVSVERKEARQRRTEITRRNEMLWRAVAQSFNDLGLPFQAKTTKSDNFSPVYFGDSNVHYEWFILKGKSALEVALHFQHDNIAENDRLLQQVSAAEATVCSGVSWAFDTRRFGKKWASAAFVLPYDDTTPVADIAPVAAEAMRALIERTWPIIRGQVKCREEFAEFSQSS